MQVVQTAGPPPNQGKMKRAISGWTRKSRNAPQKMVRLKANMAGYAFETPPGGEGWGQGDLSRPPDAGNPVQTRGRNFSTSDSYPSLRS